MLSYIITTIKSRYAWYHCLHGWNCTNGSLASWFEGGQKTVVAVTKSSHKFEVHAALSFKSLSLKSDICTFNFITTSLVFLEPKPKNPQTTGDGMGDKNTGRSMENLLEFGGKPRGRTPAAEPKQKPGKHQIFAFYAKPCLKLRNGLVYGSLFLLFEI